jgi:hypothetical protein
MTKEKLISEEELDKLVEILINHYGFDDQLENAKKRAKKFIFG